MSLQFIIDGYNLLNHPEFRRKNKQIQDPALLVLSFIRTNRLTGSPKNRIILIFDGFPPQSAVNQDFSDAAIIFSRKISADEKIKKLVEEAANHKNIHVVSDDKEISFMVKSLGARSIGIEEFINAKEKSKNCQKKDLIKPELNYSQIHEINQEMSKIWLKPQN